MTLKNMAIVLDSWSIIAYLENEPAGAKVERIIADAHEHGTPLMRTVVNAGEVWYITARSASPDDPYEALRDMRRLGIQFIEADWAITREAARIQSRVKMSCADCSAAALAGTRQAVLVTGDPAFKQLGSGADVHWI